MIKRVYEDGIVVDVDDPKNKRRCKVALLFYGKNSKNEYNVITDWIRPFQPTFGEGQEGIYSKLKVGDLVIVSYRDYPLNQQPFIAFKDTTNDDDNVEQEDNKIFKFNDITLTFKPDGSIEFDGGGFIDIEINGLSILNWLSTTLPLTLGNLGFPIVFDAGKMLELNTAANVTRSKVIFKK